MVGEVVRYPSIQEIVIPKEDSLYDNEINLEQIAIEGNPNPQPASEEEQEEAVPYSPFYKIGIGLMAFGLGSGFFLIFRALREGDIELAKTYSKNLAFTYGLCLGILAYTYYDYKKS